MCLRTACRVFASLAVLGAGANASAADLALSGVASGATRWFEMYSDAFVQLDKGFGGNAQLDGFFLVYGGTPTPEQLDAFDPHAFNPTTFNEIGGGVDAFPNDEFFNLGTLSYNATGLTGSGFETAAITAYQVDFDANIADDDAIVSQGYATVVHNAAGTVKFSDGRLIDVALNGPIDFVYDFSLFGEGNLTYSGVFKIHDGQFQLFVDGTYPTDGASPLRYIWDSAGTVDQVLPLQGDYDRDRDVDGADLLVWQRQLGASSASYAGADGNGDRAVNAGDLQLWRQYFAFQVPGVAVGVVVPEPSRVTSRVLAAWLLCIYVKFARQARNGFPS